MEIYVWGTGCAAGELMDRALPPERVRAFVDSAPSGPEFLGRPVLRPEQLAGREIDLLLVASRHTEEIARQAEALGLAPEKLLFLQNNWQAVDRNQSYAAAEALLGRELTEQLKAPQRLLRRPLWESGGPLSERELENDYVRVSTLRLLCRRLDTVPGAAAELGVYRGAFARCIKALLPERTLYLFDTFEGFDAQEAAGESPGFVQAHRNTALERVLAAMPQPERVCVRAGRFPDSLEGLEERFALVSLDVDLEESTLAGLRYFYPRLSPGGYLLLHDYNSPKLPGVRRALERYEREWGAAIPAVPLCDINGSLVLCKLQRG